MSQEKINAEHSGSKAMPNHPRDLAELAALVVGNLSSDEPGEAGRSLMIFVWQDCAMTVKFPDGEEMYFVPDHGHTIDRTVHEVAVGAITEYCQRLPATRSRRCPLANHRSAPKRPRPCPGATEAEHKKKQLATGKKRHLRMPTVIRRMRIRFDGGNKIEVLRLVQHCDGDHDDTNKQLALGCVNCSISSMGEKVWKRRQ